RSLGAAGARPIEGELDGVEQRGLAAAVDAAKEDDGTMASLHGRGREVKRLLAAKEAEIAERELLEDHTSLFGAGGASTIGKPSRKSVFSSVSSRLFNRSLSTSTASCSLLYSAVRSRSTSASMMPDRRTMLRYWRSTPSWAT